MKARWLIVLLIVILLPMFFWLVACSGSQQTEEAVEYFGEPVDLAIFTDFVTDEVNDPESTMTNSPPEGPQYFDEVDFVRVSAAVMNDRLYVYIQMSGSFEIAADQTSYGTEEVYERTINILFDLDNNFNTGFVGWGTDIHMTFKMRQYGQFSDWGVYANNEGDTHVIDRYTSLIHNGGDGYNYVVISAPLSAVDYLNLSLANGSTIKVKGWAEAESTNYHHFAFDYLEENGEDMPELTLGGN